MEILFTEIEKIGVGPWFWVSIICTVIFGIVFAITIDCEKSILPISAAILTIIAFCFTLGFGTSSYGAKEETRYHVTIDDSVSMIEFSEKYEIIKQRDKIFIIKEKE